MHKSLNNDSGSSLVELIMVMSLIIVFGFTIFILINTGGNVQEKIVENKNQQTDARVAMSYINVILRKKDAEKRLAIEEVSVTGEKGILIKEITIDGSYDTWIYFYKGQILECVVNPGEQPEPLNSFIIADIDGFYVDMDEESGLIASIFQYEYNGEKQELASWYKTRHTTERLQN